MTDKLELERRLPGIETALPRLPLATLPTPVAMVDLDTGRMRHEIAVKYDNLSGPLYGGNKVRKLEYLLAEAKRRGRRRIATFGAAGSNHALATALYARQAGFECTCFLSGQSTSPWVARNLNKHLENGTELVRFGGHRSTRLSILRQHLWGRQAYVIPMGGSSWLGTVGFVAAGVELAAQVAAGDIEKPERIYVASGTLGTAAGLGIGLALAGMQAEVHAVRVSDESIANDGVLQRLVAKTLAMLAHRGIRLPGDLLAGVDIRLRHRWFAPGYGKSTPDVDAAIQSARSSLGLELEQTYTGKAMAALVSDLEDGSAVPGRTLYWHTANSVPLDVADDQPLDAARLPEGFSRYFLR